MERKCSDCEWYQKERNSPGGLCRLSPPSVNRELPQVSETDFCSHYVSAAKAQIAERQKNQDAEDKAKAAARPEPKPEPKPAKPINSLLPNNLRE